MAGFRLTLAAAAAAVCAQPGAALMFHSTRVYKQWDTWVFVENNTYFGQ